MSKVISKKSVRKQHISFWFNQLKNGVSNEESIKANIDYSGYFLYDKEKEEMLANPEELELFGIAESDVQDFQIYLTKFDLVKTPKHLQKGDGASRISLNTVESAIEKGVSETDVPAYIEQMNIIYTAKKEAEKFLNGKKIAISVPDRSKGKEEENVISPNVES